MRHTIIGLGSSVALIGLSWAGTGCKSSSRQEGGHPSADGGGPEVSDDDAGSADGGADQACIADRHVQEGLCLSPTEILLPTDFPGSDLGDKDFGASMDVGGDVMVIGDPFSDPPYAAVYRQSEGGWLFEQMLTRSDGATDFGEGVVTDGETIAIGDWNKKVFLYRHDGEAWVEDGVVGACAVGETWFTAAIAVQGDLLVVGTSWSGEQKGRAYVYRRGGAGWTLEALLKPATGSRRDLFGGAVALGGDRIFIGAAGDDGLGEDAGAVYVFRYDSQSPDGPATCADPGAGAWKRETIIRASDGEAEDWFAHRGLVANSTGTMFMVGNPQFGTWTWDDVRIPNGPGYTRLYRFTAADGWQEKDTLVPSQAVEDAQFGDTLAWGGCDPEEPAFAIIGTVEDDMAYVFAPVDGAWTEVARLEESSWGFGHNVTAAGASVMASGHIDHIGQVHVYELAQCSSR